jgi:hypothetical protein
MRHVLLPDIRLAGRDMYNVPGQSPKSNCTMKRCLAIQLWH